jgi:eukaryotic-like serine/threonine-protein kinase
VTIGVGYILDKYELLEKVGQGGMAVVYRGLDRSLRREVAVKVLHRHLAEHQEARDRFEREAHAVAKLRHENILEIFDFAAGEDDESYIVTEFIEGQTLKQFVTDYSIKHPEVGAMIVVQVCRALGHAHSLGVLHRDIKPENIMVRNDGVVKLMDFGIAQMLDMQRMTVTGQLLGSPAYMSPEHVEGGQLDFRTDIFSVGILLYQLVTGALPFSGKNPHEILKRIAECKYPDPRQMSPQVGKELAGIIDRAMAREKDDRFHDISEMLAAIEGYLEGCGIRDCRQELERFFAAPASYEMALRARLVDHLVRRGRQLCADDRVAALEQFNRVLTLEPDHAEVLAEIDRMSRRARGTRMATVFAVIVAVGGIAAGTRAMLSRGAANATSAGDAGGLITAATPAANLPGGAAADAGVGVTAATAADAATIAAAEADAAIVAVAVAPPADARRAPIREPVANAVPIRPPRPTDADAAPASTTTAPRTFTLRVFPRDSEYRVGGGAWVPIAGQEATFELDGAATIEVRNPDCCEERRVQVTADAPSADVTLGWLPGQLVARCDVPGVRVQIDGRVGRLDKPNLIPLGREIRGERDVAVEFFTGDGSRYKKSAVTVRYAESKVVTCDFD